MKFRSFLSCLIVGVGLLGVVGAARAQNRADCARRVQQDQRDLARAIDRYGYYSSQARHERTELDRDAAKCGYSDSDRDDRWRDNRGPYNDIYGQRAYENPAFDIGYRDGAAVGQRDREKGKAFRPDKNDYYEDADHGYERAYGDKRFYQNQYREAFQRGYEEGYGYRRR
jgi:hypothetical protein